MCDSSWGDYVLFDFWYSSHHIQITDFRILVQSWWSGFCLCADTDNLITITPAKLNLTTETAASGGTVTILCEPPKVGVRTLVRLGIQRNISSSPNATVVNLADVGNDRGHRIAKVLSNTIVATVTGSIGEKYLQLTMSRMSCRDDGVYICESSFFIQSAGNIVKSKRINASLSIEGMDKSS